MIDANTTITIGENTDYMVDPCIPLVEFNMKEALVKMVKEVTTRNDGFYAFRDCISGSLALTVDAPIDTVINELMRSN